LSLQPVMRVGRKAEKRMGIYGGAFDPPHLAHIALAQAAIEQFALDELIVLPTGHAWHKSRQLTDAAHRVAMTGLAFADVPRTRVDERETMREGATYTVHTLHELRAEHAADAQWFVLMGEDQWLRFALWHRFEEILANAIILVAKRPDAMRANAVKPSQNAPSFPHETVHMPLMDVSATAIRSCVSQSLSIDHLVKPAVARYIASQALYQTP
jgi:nicotinate-nucleotide adenylyltransferase